MQYPVFLSLIFLPFLFYNAFSQTDPADVAAFGALCNSTNIEQAVPILDCSNPCLLTGFITCSGANPNQRITALTFSGKAINGTLPTIWPELITSINLNTNSLTGTIPTTGFPTVLSLLKLDSNFFTGVIPTTFTSSLKTLNLYNNELTGELLFNFSALLSLSIDLNILNCPITNYESVPVNDYIDAINKCVENNCIPDPCSVNTFCQDIMEKTGFNSSVCVPLVLYTVASKTSDDFASDSPGLFKFRLFGDQGRSTSLVLNAGKFRKGQTKIASNFIRDLGIITALQLTTVSTDGWRFQTITVNGGGNSIVFNNTENRFFGSKNGTSVFWLLEV